MMKFLSILCIAYLLVACNETADPTTALPNTVEKKDSPVNKTPAPDTRADLLNPSVINNQAWEKKKTNGIAWLGIGTEPFWSVERKIDSIIFQLSDWEKPVALKAIRTMNSKDSVVYVSELPSQKLRTVIIPDECSDGMSDRKYDYSVTVIYNGSIYKGCAVIFNP